MAKLFISAGELSGDVHGSHLIKQVSNVYPNTHFFGMGGFHMQNVGCDLLVDNRQFSLIGIVEIAKQLVLIKKIYQTLTIAIKQQKPDLVVLIDFSGLNLKLARYAHQLGIKVLYYVAPQVWAWRQNRLKRIKRYVHHMAVIYPFEVTFYERHQIPVSYVGNPIVSELKITFDKNTAREHFQLDANNPVVGLVPGSRKSEIARLLPTMLAAAQLLHEQNPKIQFILPLAASLTIRDIKTHLNKYDMLNIKIIPNQLSDCLIACDAAIVVSGTVTLEIALLEIPMVIIYKLNRLNYQIGKRLIKTQWIGLCNIMAQEKIVNELIQKQANPKIIQQEIQKILTDNDYRTSMITKFKKVKESFSNQQQITSLLTVIKQLITLD